MADSPRASALAAYRRFFEGWNSRQPELWAGALHFPHVRISAQGPVNVVPSPEAHVAAMSWGAVEATGWDHSVEIPPEVIHEGQDRVHIAGGWTRYTKENEPIISSFVTYVITRIGDSWGIQSRFAVDPGPAGLSAEHVGTAEAVIRSYLTAWNEKRFHDATGELNYPAVQVYPGRVVSWHSSDEHLTWLVAQPWRKIGLAEIRPVQAGPSAVNFALTLTEDGRESQALVLVTLREGHWGFQAESTVE